MRALGRLTNSSSTATTARQNLIISSKLSSSAAGGGRGRGRGGAEPLFAAVPGKSETDESSINDSDKLPPLGLGRGKGKPIPSSRFAPSFSPWKPGSEPSAPAGRGKPAGSQPDSGTEQSPDLKPKKPIFFRKEDGVDFIQKPTFEGTSSIPHSIMPGMLGSGRGKSSKPDGLETRVEENRHMRRRTPIGSTSIMTNEDVGGEVERPANVPRMSREEAIKRAVEILKRPIAQDAAAGRGRGRGRGFRGRGRGGRRRDDEDLDDAIASGIYLGDNADGERLTKKVGEENMNVLKQIFEQIFDRVAPSPMEDAYLEALDTNNRIEYEPEYLIGDLEKNPDIDDKPPISLEEALEKCKPFLMAYEGIQSHEEWEEIINELFERVPYMKELIDIYCTGPDRVPAMQQKKELERIGSTLPENVSSSVKNFTDRAILSLQSNPGWGFKKKCNFMNKLVWRVSDFYERKHT